MMAKYDASGPDGDALPDKAGWRSYLGPGLRLLITIGILSAIALRVDLPALAQNIRSASPLLLAAALAVLVLSPLLGGVRWWIVLKAMGQPARIGPVTAIFWIGTALSQVLPNVAAEGLKIWIARRRGIQVKAAIQSVLFERLTMVLTLLLLVVLTQPLVTARIASYGPLWMAPLLLACGILGLGFLAISDRLIRRFQGWAVLRLLVRLSASARIILSSRWALPLLVISMAGHLILVVTAWQVGQALGMTLTFADCLAFFPLAIVAMVLPVSISGWGVREGLLIVLFGAVGIATPAALAFSVLYGLLIVVVSLPGLVAWCIGADRRALHDHPEQTRFQDLERPE